MGRSTQAGTRAASSKKVSTKKASPKKVSPKNASPKKTSPKKASPKKAIPKKAPVALAPGQIAETKPGPVTTESRDLAPAWATKPPDASGSLPVPDAKKKSLSTALGRLDRRFAIVRKVGMSATRSRAGTWGLDRQLSADDGGGRDVRRVLDVLAAQELPLISLELWTRRTSARARAPRLGSRRS